MFHDSNQIICARNGSPLVIGLGESEMFISSDPHPLGEHTQKVVYLEDGDIAVVSKDGLSTHRIEGSTDHKAVSYTHLTLPTTYEV